MATFNLAMYFMKGLGGLPVDVETAKLLLAQAAENGVPEVLISFLYFNYNNYNPPQTT